MTGEHKERKNDEKIIFFMGKVTQYMENDKLWKENDRKANTENRLTAVETKQNGMYRVLAVIGLFIAGISSRIVYKLFH